MFFALKFQTREISSSKDSPPCGSDVESERNSSEWTSCYSDLRGDSTRCPDWSLADPLKDWSTLLGHLYNWSTFCITEICTSMSYV